MRKYQLLLFLLLSVVVGKSQTKNFLDVPFIEVSGNADTSVIPDEIYIRILISEKDTRDKISIEELESKLISSLKSISIDVSKDLQTSDLVSDFRTYLLKGKDVVKSKRYVLKVRDASVASKVFYELEKIGISNVAIDRVEASNLEDIKNLMRSKAIENARSRAIALTKPLGQLVGSAVYISDTEVNRFDGQQRSQLQEVVVTGYAFNNKSDIQQPNIEFEKIKVSINVNVKFILKP